MEKKTINKNYIIGLVVFISIIIVIIIGLLCFGSKKDSNSLLKDKEDVISYLEKYFGDKDFEIGERKELSEKICDNTGYSWPVKSNKSGVSFKVYEQAYYNNSNGECSVGIIDDYEENTPEVFYKNEKLESDNKYHYIFYPTDYNSNEELANKIYELINKYYLKKKLYAVRLIIKVENENVAVMPEDINSPEDIIKNYLSK